MLDHNTFGNSAAALELTRILNAIKSKPLNRKVSTCLTHFTRTTNELFEAYCYSHLSGATTSKLLQLLRREAHRLAEEIRFHDKLIGDLTCNVMISRVKEGLRFIDAINKLDAQ